MKNYREYIKNKSQIKLHYFNEEIYCQILKESAKLILVRDIKDWHYDAYMIFPKQYIKKVTFGKNERCRSKILPPLKRKQFIKDIDKIELSTLKNALYSLYKLKQGVCIENASKNNYSFVVGKIKKLKNKSLVLNEIDLCGRYEDKSTKIKYNDVTCIFYKDEYSTKLFDYADKSKRHKA